jgi:N-methylhydantoinase A/oxoprolinase/acetone carboxylase beta subunit
MPICAASQRWPEVKEMLRELISQKRTSQFPLHEFFYLVREPADLSRYDKHELALIEAFRKGPCLLGNLKAARIDLYHLESERLEAEGVLMRCGLTPTDFMHLKGDYTEYDTEASRLAAEYLLSNLEREASPEELCALANEAYSLVEEHIYVNLLRILLAQQYPSQFARGLDPQTEFLVRQAWARRDTPESALIRFGLETKASLVGIGAPTHVFLPTVSKALGTAYILPENAEVANAIGALKADISTLAQVEISQGLAASGHKYYVVHAPQGSTRHDDLDQAIETAKLAAEEAALKEARARGALGELAVSTEVQRHSAVSKLGSEVALGCTVASAVTVRFG